jgi:pimeloyl-ACP methyl ester carboxylesterase
MPSEEYIQPLCPTCPVQPVTVPVNGLSLMGDLCVPPEPKGLVVFAHGSGSSRLSPRNTFVANALNHRRIATLLIDLLTEEEDEVDERTREYRFDIPRLAGRLVKIGDWAVTQTAMCGVKLGYFGASTGAAAALEAAADRPNSVAAVVSRGGRPDLAARRLADVRAPTLLIVGEKDVQVFLWNKAALELLNEQSRLELVPGATHLFEEPGALETVVQLAAGWFEEHFK